MKKITPYLGFGLSLSGAPRRSQPARPSCRRCGARSRRSGERQKEVYCTRHLFPWKQRQKVRSNLQKLIFMVCILLNPILLIPPDSALAIRHNVFFIGVLFNNTLIDGDRSIRIRGQPVFQTLEISRQWSITNCSLREMRVFMICARPRCLYRSRPGSVRATLWRAAVWVMVGGEGEWYKVVQGL